jgi:hypothetical protein
MPILHIEVSRQSIRERKFREVFYGCEPTLLPHHIDDEARNAIEGNDLAFLALLPELGQKFACDLLCRVTSTRQHDT